MTITPLISDSQWSAAEIQVINWGGFEGHHRMSFALGATLVTGTSGSGKSTLLDAVIADLMPHTVPFNGASNDSVGGPPRAGQQRSVITYLRGKRDTTAGGADGRLTDKVLRGDGEPTWGAVALTFVNSDTRRFTVLRTYFVRADATSKDGVTERRFTVPGKFNLADIADLQEGAFAPQRMKARFPDIKHHSNYNEFRQVFCIRLGIGNTDSGEKALRLLARIQAAHPLSTVDQLYKSMVLEEPDTLKRAEDCLNHFAALDQSFRDLETAGNKEQVLRGITEEHQAWEGAVARASRIDRFAVWKSSSLTPFKLWQLRHRRRLLDKAEVTVRHQLADARAAHTSAKGRLADVQREVAEVEQLQRDNGGDALHLLEARLKVADADLAKAQVRLDGLLTDTQILNVSFGTEQSLAESRAAARKFTENFDGEHDRLTAERDKLNGELPGLTAQIGDLRAELRSLSERDDMVPTVYHTARKMIAEAAGLKVSDLPFAAELIDIHPEFEQWRDAAEVVLRSIGLTMLVDLRRQDELRKRIDRLKLPQRINFDGVDLGVQAAPRPDRKFLSGRLVFKDESPFTSWVKERVTRTGTDHLCVDDPSQLGGSTPKVTVNGQTSNGRRGAHGRNEGQRPILGFSNAALKDDIREQLQVALLREAGTREGIAKLNVLLSKLTDLNQAHIRVTKVDWDLIDVTGLSRHIDDLTGQHQALLAKSDVLAALTARHKNLSGQLDTARGDEHDTRRAVALLDQEWAKIGDAQDATTNELVPIEDSETVTLTDEDDTFLQAKLAEQSPDVAWNLFDRDAGRLRDRLGEESRRERLAAEGVQKNLEQKFAIFGTRWPDPNRGTTIEWYRDYAAIYDDIVSQGLHTRQAKFQLQMQEWSGQDLKLLNNAYDQSQRDIEERMGPVNRFLANVPFGPQREQLQMTMKEMHNPEVDRFRSSLRTLSSDTTKTLSEDDARARFLTLRTFMGLLGWSETGTGKRSDDLLDVRRHVRIGASRFDADGREAGVYESLAGKSGGESQELAAFIIGAALRYQLGDGDRPQPRFAPVFLDEGFVKADWEYAGRAVQAWRSLGFQLIVSAPLDKVTALEPHMDAAAVITKNQDTGFSFVHEFADMQTWAQAQDLRDAS